MNAPVVHLHGDVNANRWGRTETVIAECGESAVDLVTTRIPAMVTCPLCVVAVEPAELDGIDLSWVETVTRQ